MSVARLFLVALCAPLLALAAENPMSGSEAGAGDETEARVLNPQINTWVEGTISRIDRNGELVVKGSECPFATAHSQMKQQLHKELSGVDGAQQRMQVIRQVREQWQGKLNAAMNEKRGPEKEYTFKQPVDKDDLVILDAQSFRELPFFKRLAAIQQRREELGSSDMTLAEAYKAREARVASGEERPLSTSYEKGQREGAGEKVREKIKERVSEGREKLLGERLSINDLKEGDKVLVGCNSNDNTAYSIIKGELKQGAQSTSEPAQSR